MLGLNEVRNPRVAYQDGRFLVVWATSSGNIEGKLVSASDGKPLGGAQAPALPVARTARLEGEPDVAGIGGKFVVVYSSKSGADSDIYATDVYTDGSSGSPFPVATGHGTGVTYLDMPAITAVDTSSPYLFVAYRAWVEDDPSAAYARHVPVVVQTKDADAGGVAETTIFDTFDPRLELCTATGRMDVAANPTLGHAVVAVPTSCKAGGRTEAGIFTHSTAAKGQWFLPMLSLSTEEREPAVAYVDQVDADGNGSFLVAYNARNGTNHYVAVQKLDSLGSTTVGGTVPLGTGTFEQSSPAEMLPALASNGREFLAAWDDDQNNGTFGTILATRLTSMVEPLDIPSVILGASGLDSLRQTDLAVATNAGGVSLIVWENFGKVRGAIYDASSMTVTHSVQADFAANNGRSPAVASDGSAFYVVWEEGNAQNRQVWGQLVAPDGRFPVTKDLVSGVDAVAPALTYSPSRGGFFAAWRRADADLKVVGRQISWNGQIVTMAPEIWLGYGTSLETPPALAPAKDLIVVAWDSDGKDVVGVSVRADDSVGSEVNLTAEVDRKDGARVQDSPAIACKDSDCLLLVRDREDSLPDPTPTLVSIRIAADPNPTYRAHTRSYKSNMLRGPSMVFDGSDFVATWVDERAGYPQVFGSRVDLQGALLDGKYADGFTVSEGEGPALAPLGGGKFLVTAQRSNRGIEAGWAFRVE